MKNKIIATSNDGSSKPEGINPTRTLPDSVEGRVGSRKWQTPPGLWEKLKPFAREMRKDQTPAEKVFWSLVRNHQINGYKFRRQHAIDRFIVDFYCSELKLIIEIDGEIHQFQRDYDQIRQEFLESLGNQVIRFTNQEILENPDKIRRHLEEIISSKY